jgi:AsmA protein
MRALKILAALAALGAVALIALLLIGIPSGLVNAAIQSRVERDTGYRIAVAGPSTVGLWPALTVTLQDVTLSDPKTRDDSQITIGRLSAQLTAGSVFSGKPQIAEMTLTKPVLRVPLLRDRSRAPAPAPQSAAAAAVPLTVEHVTIADGTVVLANPQDRVETRIDAIHGDIWNEPDGRLSTIGRANVGGSPVGFTLKAKMPPVPLGRQTIPIDLKLDAPDLLPATLTAKAEVRFNGPVLLVNGVSGMLGDGAFNGWASADLASKPLVKIDLDFQRLTIGTPKSSTLAATQAPWSDAPIDLKGLNYLDAQLRMSAAELTVGSARFQPAAFDATLGGGVLKATFTQLGIYGGQASGDLSVDVSRGAPSYALRTDLDGVRALPLLSGLADFDRLDGKLQARIAVQSTGTSQRAIMTNLAGTTFASFQDAEIRGLNVAKMIRALTSGTLEGWQLGPNEATDLSQLAASFRIERGQAATSDLTLAGPLVRMTGAGTIDLAAKALALRVEPKLVMTTQGQGGAADPVGLGIPVVIQGPWSAPRFYPDVAGILDNPDAAYAQLRALGQGLFGSAGSGAGAANPLGGPLGETLGTLLQQGLRAAPPPSANPKGAPPAPANPNEAEDTMKAIMNRLFGR